MRCCRAIYALLLVSLLGAASAAPVESAEQPMLQREAPAFSLPSLGGETVNLADYAGRPVVLHFGAGW